MNRYRRQIILPNWGVETQEKLQKAKVFIAGAGGLGCPAAVNLAMAGIGTIRICDSDAVEISNLNRQFLHMEERIGKSKVDSACATLLCMNSEAKVEPIAERIDARNVDDLVGDSEIILDCVDNFPTRQALNLCSVRKGIPMVHGAIWGLEGRVTFLHPPSTPCLRCIFPQGPAPAEIPVLGAISCAIGSLQAVETIKYLANVGELLTGRMLILDCSTMQFQELEVVKDPQCPVCGGK